ncbi:glycosyltransferase family 2 protein [candidate division KSB1 bacterium]|nr:MAG: glycosyltransferase family 2 protein [candidate division KSB1 bacterium]MBC6948016.1 glycosyltransferase family 2 protein [candidate division KSB1 bacterium]MCE7943901.1 glycosyltransferase family 2 protein [Chlorobi bacterium CHB1]
MNEHTPTSRGNAPLVVAVVLNWNGYDDTAKCVLSLQKAAYANLQIILVDNASTDGSAGRLERDFPELPFIKLSHNGGYAAGNNAGIKLALERRADYVLVLNNDVVVEPGFLWPMVQLAEKNPAAGVVTCKALLQSGNGRIYCTGGNLSRLRCGGVPLPPGERDREGEVQFISGCILLARREVFEKLGSFDERFFMYFEDVEFSRRVRRQFKLFYTPAGVVYHKSGGGDKWKNYTETYLYYTSRNRLWVFQNESRAYRLYVILYGFLNAFAKSAVIAAHSFPVRRQENRSEKRLMALWRGMRDGMFGNPAQNNQDDLSNEYAPPPDIIGERELGESL